MPARRRTIHGPHNLPQAVVCNAVSCGVGAIALTAIGAAAIALAMTGTAVMALNGSIRVSLATDDVAALGVRSAPMPSASAARVAATRDAS